MDKIELLVMPEEAGIRIDRFLSNKLEEMSRSYLQKLLKDNLIYVNGGHIKSNYKVQPTDQIIIEIPEAETLDILPEDIPLDILYEDEDVLVVNKPKGMVVHPSAGHTSSFVSLSGKPFRNKWSYASRNRPSNR